MGGVDVMNEIEAIKATTPAFKPNKAALRRPAPGRMAGAVVSEPGVVGLLLEEEIGFAAGYVIVAMVDWQKSGSTVALEDAKAMIERLQSKHMKEKGDE